MRRGAARCDSPLFKSGTGGGTHARMHGPTATTLQHRSPIYCVTNANVVDCSIGAVVVLECRALLEYYFY